MKFIHIVRRGLLAITVAAITIAGSGQPVQAATGSLTFSGGWTNNKSDILTGSLPTQCSDLAVAIFDDYSQGTEVILMSEFDAGFTVGSGSWSLNLASSGTVLPNGWYNVYLASKCGAAGYDSPNFEDFHFDSLYVVPAGCDSGCVPVHRFYNYKQGVHFYTSREDEKLRVFDMTDTFRYEGISSFGRAAEDASAKPVHRFYNFKQGVHFYTSNQAEASHVNDTASHTFRYEGVAYYSHSSQATNTVPVHRFYNFKQGVHFFTSNQAEATNVNNTAGHTFRYEGVGSYNFENK